MVAQSPLSETLSFSSQDLSLSWFVISSAASFSSPQTLSLGSLGSVSRFSSPLLGDPGMPLQMPSLLNGSQVCISPLSSGPNCLLCTPTWILIGVS